jgi:transcription elongation factor Elf1
MGARNGDSREDGRSEVLHLPTVTCPGCGEHEVLVQITVGEAPVLTCMSCGHNSLPGRRQGSQHDG